MNAEISQQNIFEEIVVIRKETKEYSCTASILVKCLMN